MLYENYIDRMKNYHDLKESIGIDVVNLSDNILYLKDKCYTSFLDLAIVYYIAPNSHQNFGFLRMSSKNGLLLQNFFESKL